MSTIPMIESPPFRDGAAAMALMAARKAERQVVIIPVAIKRWYIEDPRPSMLQTLDQLEKTPLLAAAT